MPLSDTFMESLAAEAVREGLADALFTFVGTPIGRLTVVSGPRGVVRIGRDDPTSKLLAEVADVLGPRVLRSERELTEVRDALSAYLEGDTDAKLDIPFDLSLVRSPFRRAVLEILGHDIPRGATVSYGALAARAGSPNAARAVGSACATNPIPLIVPCHRVLPGSGRLGNYGLGGPDIKRQLLELEGALPQRL
jgi:methylated-DNA-[protein]-cysteine S-methyltransferase